ncbi:allophanate hydrolase [Paenibacillus sp. MMS18-CY102]|uniref:allophanate hydrolase n=1 Tax=Paenibacillus sp. MMS18-CY102 TaxID=2682849 RepID=UPI001365942F|nr:allophanate hydrolase [Paenibacillus sp. MMS18-CY102]MWC30156.1 allophanate hydrolase [Paenibacillus sp. MMS18-CY102]
MQKTTLPSTFTIAWLQGQYAGNAVTPEEVIGEIIRRADAAAAMNIWITPPSAELVAPYLERLKTLDRASSPLWGIPFAIKDNIDLAGVPTTAACAEYAYTPTEHSAVVERLIAAGAIPVGKTNLDQFATGLVGTRSPYGETHNALRPELISGGSSSGSAVAVAQGQAAFSLGTDTAGSGRIPAALNGLVGYKPSVGAWPLKGVVPACESLDCVTVFAADLTDAYTVDAVARGVHAADPWSRSIPAPQPALPARIVLPDQTPSFYGPYAAEYEAAWHAAVAQFAALGITVEFVDTELFSAAAALLYEGPWVAERWAGLGGFIEAHPDTAFAVTERILRSGAAEQHTAASLFQAMHQLQRYRKQACELLQGAVLVLPTAGGTWTRDQVRDNPVETNRDMGRYTNHCNLLDLCAVAVPAGIALADTPFGITLFGLAGEENYVRGVAERFAGLAPQQSTASLESQTVPSAPAVPAVSGVPANASSTAVETTLVAVCGLHMRGYPFEKQMQGCGARFIEETKTAARYKLLRLATVPAKPGLIKQSAGNGGAAITLEVWEMPLSAFGGFTASIPSPLGIGKVELADGREVPGFICEGYAEQGAEDITAFGGWRNYLGSL